MTSLKSAQPKSKSCLKKEKRPNSKAAQKITRRKQTPERPCAHSEEHVDLSDQWRFQEPVEASNMPKEAKSAWGPAAEFLAWGNREIH